MTTTAHRDMALAALKHHTGAGRVHYPSSTITVSTPLGNDLAITARYTPSTKGGAGLREARLAIATENAGDQDAPLAAIADPLALASFDLANPHDWAITMSLPQFLTLIGHD